MIINAEKNDIKVIGDIKEFKTSIDPKNIEFITTLLSSNLYSNPEKSFIREIVSNAWDSHVEAGTTDTPVIIRFKEITHSNWEITIRDFGIGLSPERFKEVYCNIGSSTKRESNELIGGFGIGKYSSLACTDTVFITSYYKGISYLYVMVKSGNTITTNLVSETPTKEKDGVEVTIKNISYIIPYMNALDSIVFFPNIYIDGISNIINKSKINRFNNFAVASVTLIDKILLGNVLYPCDTEKFIPEVREFLYNIGHSGIVVKFNIGELNITPNRENIIYTKDTINKITDRILAAKKELEDLIANKLNKDYDNLYEYWKLIRGNIKYNPLTDDYTSCSSRYADCVGYFTHVIASNLTFKGSKVLGEADCTNFLNIFFYLPLPFLKGLFHNDKFYQNKIPSVIEKRTRMDEPLILAINNTRLTAIAKAWLNKTYEEYTIITEFDKDSFKLYIEDKIADLKTFHKKDEIIDYMYEYLTSKIIKINLDTNTDFLKFKEDLKKNKISIKKIKEVIIYIQETEVYRRIIKFPSIEKCIKYIKTLKKGIILTDLQDGATWIDIANTRKLIVISARKEIVEALKEANPSFLVDKQYILKKDPVIVKFHTMIEEFRNAKFHVPSEFYSRDFLLTVPIYLREEFCNIIRFYHWHSKTNAYYLVADKDDIPIDSYTQYICRKFIKYFNSYTNLIDEIDFPSDKNSLENILTSAVILKKKIYRLDYKMYEKVKSNKLIKVLCEK